MLATAIASCGIVWSLVFGCSNEDHVPVTNTIIQANQQKQQTEQQRIQAQQQTEQDRLRASVERAAIQATASAHNASVQASIAATEVEAERQRNYDTQLFLSDRFAWQERAKTERQFNLIILLVSIVATAGVVAAIWIIKGHPGPPVHRSLPRASSLHFRQVADRHNWEGWKVESDGKRLVGTDHNGKQWLLGDR